MKSVSRGMWISVSLAVVSPLPVQVFLHIWTILAPPLHQLTRNRGADGWREEEGVRGCSDGRGIEMGVSRGQSSPLGGLPFCAGRVFTMSLCVSDVHGETNVCTQMQGQSA